MPRASSAFDATCPLGSGSTVSCTAQGWIVLSLLLLAVLCISLVLRYCKLHWFAPVDPDDREVGLGAASAVVPTREVQEEVKTVAGPRDLRVENSSRAGEILLEDSPPPNVDLPAVLQMEGRSNVLGPECFQGCCLVTTSGPEFQEDSWNPDLTKLKGDWDLDLEEAAPGNAVNVVLECVDSAGVDVGLLESGQRRLVRRVKAGESWTIGPRHQPRLFCRIAPDVSLVPPPELFELALEAPCLYLRRLALDMPLLLNGVPLRQPAFVLWHKVEIGLCFTEGSAPQFTFKVLLDSSCNGPLTAAVNERRLLGDARSKQPPEAHRDIFAKLGFGFNQDRV